MNEDVSQWIDALSSPDVIARRRACEELSYSDDVARAIIPLLRACGDRDEEVRELATACLEEAPAPAAEELSSLIHLLADSHSDVSYWAATLIGRMELRAAPASDSLTSALTHSEMAVRQRAAWALGKIGPLSSLARAALVKASQSDNPRLARLAEGSLKNRE